MVAAQNLEKMQGIVWLASYPKSGNTWLRLLFANYFYGSEEQPVTINTVQRLIPSEISRALYEPLCKKNGWDIQRSMGDFQKRDVFMEAYARSEPGTKFLKTHSCFHTNKKKPYFSPLYTKGFISIVRDPRDVLCSYSRHLGFSHDKTFELMADKSHTLGSEGLKTEFISSWDDYIKSFQKISYPIMTLRYEDLLKNTTRLFGGVIKNLTGSVSQDKLDWAVKNSQFSVLKEQEEKEGFKEQSSANDRFFNAGIAGGWKDQLSVDLVKKIEGRFGEIMKDFGYL